MGLQTRHQDSQSKDQIRLECQNHQLECMLEGCVSKERCFAKLRAMLGNVSLL